MKSQDQKRFDWLERSRSTLCFNSRVQLWTVQAQDQVVGCLSSAKSVRGAIDGARNAKQVTYPEGKPLVEVFASEGYQDLGACAGPGPTVELSCDDCRVKWRGGWNCACPKCGSHKPWKAYAAKVGYFEPTHPGL